MEIQIKIYGVLMLAVLVHGYTLLPWSRWSLSTQQEYHMRRNENMPVKTPGHQCQCPPSKECVINFKINEDAIEFLNIQGVLTEEEMQKIKEDIENIEPTTKVARYRRKNDEVLDDEEECCCPPRNVMMPTFITENKFNETLLIFNNGGTTLKSN